MKALLLVKSARFDVMFRHFLKAAFVMAISLVTASSASAQHTEGSNVNIFGDQTVHVGDTRTYYITPRYPDVTQYTPIWDYTGYLSSLATIIDQGRDAEGHEYIILNFYAAGHTWLSYDGLYNFITEDFDEINLHIYP